MNKKLLFDTLGWGFLLWLLGYGLGILFFTIVPPSAIGWIITPIGTLATLYVLLSLDKNSKPRPLDRGESSFKKISGSFKYFLLISIIWTLIAIVFDYFFLVKAFNPADGYYKFDVYLYYALTFTLPLLIGLFKNRS